MYTENDLAKVARRENNNKRGYLVVNPLQGKHVPVIPSKALEMFEALARVIKEDGKLISAGESCLCTDETGKQHTEAGERLLVIGFAETATAIGAALAIALDCPYIQTTRESIEGVTYFFFSETHSHATQQKLVKEDMDRILSRTDRIIFAEDEITTGNTILNLVEILEKDHSNMKFSAASLLNGMEPEYREKYEERGITLHYLTATHHSRYTDIAMGYKGDGEYHSLPASYGQVSCKTVHVGGYCNSRRLVFGDDYRKACLGLWEQIKAHFTLGKGSRILILGTEEFMYPGLYVAGQMEKEGADVRFHATTRSPIEVSREQEYPLHVRYELRSLYEGSRVTFLYELAEYDEVYVVTDAPEKEEEGLLSLLDALAAAGSHNINIVRWCSL